MRQAPPESYLSVEQVLLRLRVGLVLPNILPILDDREAGDDLTLSQKRTYQVGHIEAMTIWNVVASSRFQEVDASVDQDREPRLLSQFLHTCVFTLHHSERHLDLMNSDADE